MPKINTTVLANAIRFLSVDAIERAQSGHPGMPLGMADIATVLWQNFLKHNPKNPNWINRDRFILSNGHGAMLQYALLHLSGYDVSIEDLKAFRQLHSKTPGHPEYGQTPGVETSTGPLGQGLANAVGMAIGAKRLAAEFNREDFTIFDAKIYCFVGDGCLMEGISHEVCSLAGTLGLNNLIAFWDDNGISIDGPVSPWFDEQVPARFRAYGFEVLENIAGHNPKAIYAALKKATADQKKPVLLCCKTTLGFGAPTLAGKAQAHGAPLGCAEISAMREKLDWPYAPFEISAEIYNHFNAVELGAKQEQAWQDRWKAYEKAYPQLACQLQNRLHKRPCQDFLDTVFSKVPVVEKPMATRKSSQIILETLLPQLPALLGGSADLSGSNLTITTDSKPITKDDFSGNYLYYGVREFGMSAIMNGLALSGGHIPYGGTFLVFSDYAKNAIRLSALMHQQVIYVLTHDSIGLGEDGPTHQPVEQLTMLRAIPNVRLWRPCDHLETIYAWKAALLHDSGPTVIVLSRQALAQQHRMHSEMQHIEKGGYILKPAKREKIELIIVATGSEVALGLSVAKRLEAEADQSVQVVSMPSLEVFLAQPKAYRASVLPLEVENRWVIEAASSGYWYQIAGLKGTVFGLDHFGVSAPAAEAFEACGFSVQGVLNGNKNRN